MRRLAWIPARSGSTRIPGKNTKKFCGRPLVEWTILEALSLTSVSDIIVSTDDPEVMSLANKYDLKIVERSAMTSSPDSHITEALDETFRITSAAGEIWDVWYIMLPTDPLRIPSQIDEIMCSFNPDEWDLNIGVTHEPLWKWSGKIDEDGSFRLNFPDAPKGDTQDGRPNYLINLSLYLVSGSIIADSKSGKNLWERVKRIKPTILPELQGDIDVPEQWESIEMKMKNLVFPQWPLSQSHR